VGERTTRENCGWSHDPAYPQIEVSPTNLSACIGEPALFSVQASGATPLSYQWAFDGSNILGAIGPSYVAPSTAASNAGTYSVTVSNSYGVVTNQATLTLTTCDQLSPTLIYSSSSRTVCVGSSFELSVSAGGEGPLAYQWYLDGGSIGLATASELKVSSLNEPGTMTYSVVITNAYGSTNASVIIWVDAPLTAAVEPSSQSVILGNPIVLNAVANENPQSVLLYQWDFDGVTIPGATASSYSIGVATYTNIGQYTATLLNACGAVTSSSASVQVISPGASAPFILFPPTNEGVCLGSSAVFSVQAYGSSPLSYQWMFDSGNIAGATGSIYSPGGAATNAGTYSVTVTNEYGSASATATLTVTDPSAGVSICQQPTNLSLYAGGNAVFLVAPCGSCQVSYQWVKAGFGNLVAGIGNVTGGESALLKLSNVSSNVSGKAESPL
jgi:hypothetical protein